jgi:hypothetical protein
MNFYVTNHALHTNWGYHWDVLENMMPYEREIVINFIMQKIQEDQQSQSSQNETGGWLGQQDARWNAENGS